MYQFCINRDRPGYFHLCFKASQNDKVAAWPVKVIPAGFQLNNQPYPKMVDLMNGFKLMFGNMSKAKALVGVGASGTTGGYGATGGAVQGGGYGGVGGYGRR